MTTTPRLSIGLPVYNGETYLAESLDSLLGQSFEDYELIISDNASTDSTESICRRYARADRRIRYLRQPRNRGCAVNHNVLVDEARGEFFKWAMDDDLFGKDLLARCVDVLDEHRHVVAAHSWTAMIDDSGDVTRAVEYRLATASRDAPERFRSALFAEGGDDDGAVIRTEVLRRCVPHGSYHHAERPLIGELSLRGPFYQVPEWLYFRRDHPGCAERACPDVRSRCANFDPRRANRLRHPTVRLFAEYVLGYVTAIRRAPLSATDRWRCYHHVAEWLASRAVRGSWGLVAGQPRAPIDPSAVTLADAVARPASRP